MAIKSWTGTTGYYALDGLGSPVALIKTNGLHQTSYSYDPHGAVTETNNLTDNTVTNLNPYRFAGGFRDRSTGEVKFGRRWYDPNTGRFTQQDALEILADPSLANRYKYAAGDPVNYTDATGLHPRRNHPAGEVCYTNGTFRGHSFCYKPAPSRKPPVPWKRIVCGAGAVVGAVSSFTPAGRTAKIVGRTTSVGGLLCI